MCSADENRYGKFLRSGQTKNHLASVTNDYPHFLAHHVSFNTRDDSQIPMNQTGQ
jgi:hypothetical protein